MGLNIKSINEIGVGWLVTLRWWAAASQIIASLVAFEVFAIAIPLKPISAIILTLIFSNILLSAFQDKFNHFVLTGAVLFFDIILLTFLLYLTGGPANPFSILFLVHVALASVMLSSNWTWFLVATSIALFASLFFFHIPLPGEHSHNGHKNIDQFSFHLYGMWAAYAVAAVVIAYFLRKVVSLLRKKDRQLREMQTKQLHQERLVSLASLSAGTAHELSTPLSTIAIIAKELELALERQAPQNAECIGDAKLIRSEVDRCRKIISELGTNVGDIQAEAPSIISCEFLEKELREKIPQKWQERFKFSFANINNISIPLSGLSQSLSFLIKNAFDASDDSSPIELSIVSHAPYVEFIVKDQGQGMDEEILKNALNPFFTTKPTGQGLGLGLFLVELFAQRWGGSIRLHSKKGIGTTAILTLPNFEAKQVANF